MKHQSLAGTRVIPLLLEASILFVVFSVTYDQSRILGVMGSEDTIQSSTASIIYILSCALYYFISAFVLQT